MPGAGTSWKDHPADKNYILNCHFWWLKQRDIEKCWFCPPWKEHFGQFCACFRVTLTSGWTMWSLWISARAVLSCFWNHEQGRGDWEWECWRISQWWKITAWASWSLLLMQTWRGKGHFSTYHALQSNKAAWALRGDKSSSSGLLLNDCGLMEGK